MEEEKQEEMEEKQEEENVDYEGIQDAEMIMVPKAR